MRMGVRAREVVGVHPLEGRRVVVAFAIALLAVGCAADETATSTTTATGQSWTADHHDALGRLDLAIGHILDAVDRNDVRRMGLGPERCAAEADALAVAAREAGAVSDAEGLVELASRCASLQVPADALDVTGVVLALDPVLTAVGQIAPLLDRHVT